MKRLSEIFLLSLIQLDDQEAAPLYEQLYECLRTAIVEGQLNKGVRLPSIRDLSTLLQVSRNTVTNALDQLIAEGYLQSKPGAGTFVNDPLPDELLRVRADNHSATLPPPTTRQSSQRSTLISTSPQNWEIGNLQNPAFQYGLPALDHFPHTIWARLSARHHRDGLAHQFDFTATVGGYRPLREAIVEYVQAARGVQCDVEQVIIVSGAHQAIYLAGMILLDPGDTILVEDPGFTSAHRTFRSVGAKLVPVPLDAEGMDLKRVPHSDVLPRVAYIKPSRQHPTGRTMTVERRLELIDWARRNNGWIIEDDYGSAFHYTQRPLPALQGLDTGHRVVYFGTFSKVMFPSLRLGYIIAPPDLIDKFMSLRSIVDSYIPTVSQVILADFMEQGHFTRHLRRMRQLYAERKEIFVKTVQNLWGDSLVLESTHAGTSVTAWLPDSVDDIGVQRLLAGQDITVMPVSPCYLTLPKRSGLLLGYAACNAEIIKAGLEQVKDVLTTMAD
ncbi:MAG: PLP-dependent aminotransferase family protein [Anaerolineae bacterium]|nr:PLP-dependent aminotransferase family protein [Anaerolineae bacterium]